MKRVRQHLTGEAAVIASMLVLVAGEFGADWLTPQLSVAFVFIVCVLVSAWKPRWAEARGLLTEAHPAALTAAVALVLVFGAPLVGVDLDRTQAVTLVGGMTTLISIGTPRADV